MPSRERSITFEFSDLTDECEVGVPVWDLRTHMRAVAFTTPLSFLDVFSGCTLTVECVA